MSYTTADALAEAMREVNEARLVYWEKIDRLKALLVDWRLDARRAETPAKTSHFAKSD